MKRFIVPAILLFPLITLAVWFQVGARGPRVDTTVPMSTNAPSNSVPATNGIVTNYSR